MQSIPNLLLLTLMLTAVLGFSACEQLEAPPCNTYITGIYEQEPWQGNQDFTLVLEEHVEEERIQLYYDYVDPTTRQSFRGTLVGDLQEGCTVIIIPRQHDGTGMVEGRVDIYQWDNSQMQLDMVLDYDRQGTLGFSASRFL